MRPPRTWASSVTRRGLYRTLSRLDRRGRGILTAVHEALSGVAEGARAPGAVGEPGPAGRVEGEGRGRGLAGEARVDGHGRRRALRDSARGASESRRSGRTCRKRSGSPSPRSSSWSGRSPSCARGSSSRRICRNAWRDASSISARWSGGSLRLSQGLRLVLAPGEDGAQYVRWLEGRGTGRRRNLTLAAAPVELGALLRESLFEKAETTVLTSATLTTRGTFDFLRGRLGLRRLAADDDLDDLGPIRERSIPSPFDFGSRTLLAVPTDGGAGPSPFQDAETGRADPSGRSTGGWQGGSRPGAPATRWPTGSNTSRPSPTVDSSSCSRPIARSAASPTSSAGRASTSGGPCSFRVRGTASARGAVRDLPDDGILLGTSSFWEGVDVPGDPLRALVIHKLPFRVPTEPITAARMEAVEAEGGDSFADFMLPHAALRLKQGFGRLIRGHADRGVVVVLDDRLVTRAVRALPAIVPPSGPPREGSVERRPTAHRGLLRGVSWSRRGRAVDSSVSRPPAGRA